MIHNGTCMNKKDTLHRVDWDYTHSEFLVDFESFTVDGKCKVCDTEFQKTYSNPLLSIISKSTRKVSNFDYIVEDLN